MTFKERVAPVRRDPLAEETPAFTPNEALLEANRCLYCYDAPCIQACPTHIDVPQFIKKIASKNLIGSARTILESNLLGATCARVCPVQELCEGACVLGHEHRPIAIGRLQRFAIDSVTKDLFKPRPPSGKTVALIGSGPASLSCAGELAKLGHEVTIFEKKSLPGGLSTYGIISIREPIDIAVEEARMIERLGVRFEFGIEAQIDDLVGQYDAVFVGAGLGGSPQLGIPGEEDILDGLNYIEASKVDLNSVPVARHVAVIGAGNTAIDCATIAKRLGAETVSIVYRRSEEDMTAYAHEVSFAKNEGIRFDFHSQPIRVLSEDNRVVGLECCRTEPGGLDESGRPISHPIPDSNFVMQVDQVIKAIGQVKHLHRLDTERGFIKVDVNYQTSQRSVYAGGDCIRSHGSASTVMAVQDGKLAAMAIDRQLRGSNG